MKIHKLAGIDIGSNSVRLLVANVIEQKGQVIFKKSSLTRLPIRLGTDAFAQGKISKTTQARLIKGMAAYHNIMQVHGVQHYRACATSALREAENGPQVVEAIAEATGINIELITGKDEAKMIFSTGFMENIVNQAPTLLYIDVGGGSTELTVFHKDEVLASQSFKIGTIRLLSNKVKSKQWEAMETWVRKYCAGKKEVLMVGSGGNINRTFKLAQKRKGETMAFKDLREIYKNLKALDYQERILAYDLNPDRADVITHALKIYTRVMGWGGAASATIPKMGLADGIVRYLYHKHYS